MAGLNLRSPLWDYKSFGAIERGCICKFYNLLYIDDSGGLLSNFQIPKSSIWILWAMVRINPGYVQPNHNVLYNYLVQDRLE